MPLFILRFLQQSWLVHVLFATGIVLVSVATFYSYRTIDETKKNVERVVHTYEVLMANLRVTSNVRAQEAYCRGYALKQDTALLNNFYRATERTWMRCHELEKLATDNPTQVTNIRNLRTTLHEKQLAMDSMISMAGKDQDMVVNILLHSNQLTNKIMLRSRNIRNEETRLLQIRNESVTGVSSKTSRLEITSLVVALTFLGLGYLLSYFQSKGLQNVNAELEETNLGLEKKVADRTQDLEVQINLRNQEIGRKNRELGEARRFLLSLIPTLEVPPDLYEASAQMWPAEDVGGDYYDYKMGHGNELLLTVGDAAGHGLMAAMIVSNVHSYWHSFDSKEPADQLMMRISGGLYALKLQMAIMAMAVIRVTPGKVELTSAAMPPFLHYRAAEDVLEIISIRSMFLGSAISGGYHPQVIAFNKGDLLLIHSDGLTEARNSIGELYGIYRLKESLNRYLHLPARHITQAIYQDMRSFIGDRPQQDDVTVMAIRMVA